MFFCWITISYFVAWWHSQQLNHIIEEKYISAWIRHHVFHVFSIVAFLRILPCVYEYYRIIRNFAIKNARWNDEKWKFLNLLSFILWVTDLGDTCLPCTITTTILTIFSHSIVCMNWHLCWRSLYSQLVRMEWHKWKFQDLSRHNYSERIRLRLWLRLRLYDSRLRIQTHSMLLLTFTYFLNDVMSVRARVVFNRLIRCHCVHLWFNDKITFDTKLENE